MGSLSDRSGNQELRRGRRLESFGIAIPDFVSSRFSGWVHCVNQSGNQELRRSQRLESFGIAIPDFVSSRFRGWVHCGINLENRNSGEAGGWNPLGLPFLIS